MRNPAWVPRVSKPQDLYVDENGKCVTMAVGRKPLPISSQELPAATKIVQGGEFGQTYGTVGEVIPAEWFLTEYAQNRSAKGVMVTREAAAAALHACAWPDSNAPCGVGSNTNDDDAAFAGYDREGNCIVKLFMRGKGYFRVKIPRTMFLEIEDEK